MECDQAFLQVFRDQHVTAKDIKPDTKAIMLSDGAKLKKAVPDHVHMVVFGKSCGQNDKMNYLGFAEPEVRFVHDDNIRKINNGYSATSYVSFPDETDTELLERLFRKHLPNLARELLPSEKNGHISYFNAIKRSVTDLVQKRATEVIDNISDEKEFVIGKRVSLVENISSEEHIDALKEGFTQSFPESHMSVEKSTDSYSLVLTVSNKTDLAQI